jgi:uncharacterized protein YndB with AHSA1/START domain
MELLMEITREIELDAPVADVWRLLSDPDELAGWVGEEVRNARLDRHQDDRRVAWTWAPDGVETTVEIEIVECEPGDGDERTLLRVVERGAVASARACSIGDAWDDRLFGLEVRCVTDRLVLALVAG